MSLLKQIEEDKRRILADSQKLKVIAEKDKDAILKELPKIKEMAAKDIAQIKKNNS